MIEKFGREQRTQDVLRLASLPKIDVLLLRRGIAVESIEEIKTALARFSHTIE